MKTTNVHFVRKLDDDEEIGQFEFVADRAALKLIGMTPAQYRDECLRILRRLGNKKFSVEHSFIVTPVESKTGES